MNHPWAEVNAAVLAVLAEWTRPPGGKGNGRIPARPGRHEIDVFADRLLGVRQAEAWGDRSEIRILPGTVVTPLARDFLKRRGVDVRVVAGREATLARGQRRGEWGFAIESTRHAGLVASLRRQWLDADWCEIAAGAADWVVDAEGRGSLVLADEAAVATWRANRVAGIRAATVGDVDATTRAVCHLGANVLVVEPATRSIHQIRQIGERFRGGGAPVAPAWTQDDPWEVPR